MSKLKVLNVVSNEVEVVENKKSLVKLITAANVTKDSQKAIEKNITAALKDETVLYETFKIENFKEEETMSTENTATEIKNEQEIVYDTPESLETLTVETPETETETPVVENEVVTPAENVVVEEIENADVPVVENENTDAPTADSPATDDTKTEDTPAATEEKPNKRRVGKTLIAYENGVEIERFPSIKAAATHFKEKMNLGHMPFTPIMKSVRQNIDWNAYSFAFENESDLHIPESLKKKIAESQAKAASETKPAENAETPSAETTETPANAETIEEIVEVPVEEIV